MSQLDAALRIEQLTTTESRGTILFVQTTVYPSVDAYATPDANKVTVRTGPMILEITCDRYLDFQTGGSMDCGLTLPFTRNTSGSQEYYRIMLLYKLAQRNVMVIWLTFLRCARLIFG